MHLQPRFGPSASWRSFLHSRNRSLRNRVFSVRSFLPGTSVDDEDYILQDVLVSMADGVKICPLFTGVINLFIYLFLNTRPSSANKVGCNYCG